MRHSDKGVNGAGADNSGQGKIVKIPVPTKMFEW